MRDTPYAGPSDTDDFDGLSPDEMAKVMYEYKLLGECFETSNDDQMLGRVWLIENTSILLEGHADKLRRAQRELAAAVALARSRGQSWLEIADALDVPVNDARARFTEIS